MLKSWVEQITFSDHHVIQEEVNNQKIELKRPL